MHPILSELKAAGSSAVNAGAAIVRSVDPEPPMEQLVATASARAPRRLELPPLTADGTLPAGIHDVDLGSFLVRTATNPQRVELLQPFAESLLALQEQGVRDAYVGGSIVTKKPHPGDVDVLFSTKGPQPSLARRGLDWANGIHWHPAEETHALANVPEGQPKPTWLEYFQTNGKPGSVTGSGVRGVARIVLNAPEGQPAI